MLRRIVMICILMAALLLFVGCEQLRNSGYQDLYNGEWPDVEGQS